MPSEIPERDYEVVVFENRFPSYAVTPSAAEAGDRAASRHAPGASAAARSCASPATTTSRSADLPAERVRTVVDTWAHRTEALGRIPEVEQVFAFENRGKEIGVTLPHPHGQIYAYPYVPDRTTALLETARRHHERTGRLLGADILAAEQADGHGWSSRATHWTAYVPFAARWPLEVHLAPHRDVPDLVALDDDERDELAVIYLDLLPPRPLLRQRGRVAGQLPYIAGGTRPRRDRTRHLAAAPAADVGAARAGTSSSSSPGPSRASAAGSTTSPPERTAARLREVAP